VEMEWKCGNVEMWKCGNVEMEMWKCGGMEICMMLFIMVMNMHYYLFIYFDMGCLFNPYQRHLAIAP